MISQLTQRGSIDAESEMSPQEPPPWIIRSTAWLLMAAFLVALLIAIMMRLPETVRCPFVLVPATGADPIQSPRQALISRVTVDEGQPVNAGDELFVLRSDEIRGWDTQFRTLTEDLRSKEESLTQYETAYVAQLEIKKAEIEQAKSEVKFRENHAKTSRELVTRMEKLKMRLGALKIDLENTQQNLLTVRSPYEGVITSMDQRTVGSFVQQGQILCQLAPKDAKPRARMTLTEAGLPKLAVAQRIRYFFEAFPYQRYGAVTGKLDWISRSTVTTTDGSRFVAVGSLDRIEISPRAGQVLPLRVGMRGQAHIIVGSRTLIEYAFEPIRQLRESMRR